MMLNKYKISIVGQYLDSWDNCIFQSSLNKSEKGQKRILAMPETQDVIMHSEAVGYVLLTK
ncbi:MAG: hypothetical protein Q8O89_01315 [Nanoarchaeota archaeon]|nr:hypothetical protein [Nanoarchaeota archaeon]